MKTIAISAYTIFVCFVYLILFWFLFPVAVGSPKIALLIFAILIFSTIGAMFRSAIEIHTLLPMVRKMDEWKVSPIAPIIIFAISFLLSLAIPFVKGIDDWSGWQWAVTALYAILSFETFYSYICGLLRCFNSQSEL